MDRLFVNLKHQIVTNSPEPTRLWVSMILTAAALIGVFAGLFAFATWLERKGLGRAQNRYGPNRVGPFGLFQPIADGLKMIFKEDIVPERADRVLHFLAPILVVVPVILCFAVLPFGRGMTPVSLEYGLLFFLALGGIREIGIFMAGWGSRSKFTLLGAMRAIAQMISYEAPLVLSTLPVVVVTGTLSLDRIVEAQSGYVGGWLGRWFVWTPWGLTGFVLLLIAATAESNRCPFDLPEGESEIIAGHMVEYSGFKYALFFVGEYLGLFAISGLMTTLYLGGWHDPTPLLAWIPSWAWFFGKVMALIAFFIWLRATLPRLRPDQLMSFAWKFLLPMSLVNLIVAGVWVWTRTWGGGIGLILRWVVCAILVWGPWYVLSRALYRPDQRRREYVFMS